MEKKYTFTCSCGHDDYIYLDGRQEYVDIVLSWHTEHGLCCRCGNEDQPAKGLVEYIAERYSLPKLTGSEKQVKWAMSIRNTSLYWHESARAISTASKGWGYVLDALWEHISAQTKAGWWIDRDKSVHTKPGGLVSRYERQFQKWLGVNYVYWKESLGKSDEFDTKVLSINTEDIWTVFMAFVRDETPPRLTMMDIDISEREKKEAIEELNAERTIRPEQPHFDTPATILLDEDDLIRVRLPEYNKELRDVLARLRFSWKKTEWQKKALNIETDGLVTEVATHILANRFVVRLPDKRFVEKVLNGDYEPYNTKRIIAKDGQFRIVWSYADGDFYGAARRIHGSMWDSKDKVIKIPSTSADELLDFAEMYKFKVSDKAKALAEEARAVCDKALVGSNITPKNADVVKSSPTRPPVLETPKDVKIDESLRDND